MNFWDGDLIFLDLSEGDLSEAISSVTQRQFAVSGLSLSHLGLLSYEKNCWWVYESWKKVTQTPLHEFLKRAKPENKTTKGWYHARLKAPYQPLIPTALEGVKNRLGRIYDHDFLGNSDSHYCSQLMAEIFQEANNGKPIFEFKPMYFGDPKDPNDLARKTWETYFQKRNMEIPIGKPGISPLGIYLSEVLEKIR